MSRAPKAARKPFTPVMRRFLSDVFKPSLGKRARTDASPSPRSTSENRLPNCVALQNEDKEEDAVIITALNTVPFCCHADLLSMSRSELVHVAEALNAKLPHALQIDTCSDRSDLFIRNSIELLVGIRSVPPAPKPNRSLTSNISFSRDVSPRHVVVPMSPSSPLASRSRVDAFSLSPKLPSLLEEDEEIALEERPSKRRRPSLEDDDTLSFFDEMQIAQSSPIRLGRSLSHREAQFTFDSSSLASAHLLRSQSQKLPPRKMVGAHRNVTITRGRSGKYKNSLRPQSAVLTSTPKRRVVLQPVNSVGSFTVESLNLTLPSAVEQALSSTAPKSPKTKTGADQREVDMAEETFGMDGLNMSSEDSLSDMDISLD